MTVTRRREGGTMEHQMGVIFHNGYFYHFSDVPKEVKEERLAVIQELAQYYEKVGRPDLDLFTTDKDKLMIIWAAIHFNPVICARILFPDKPERYVSVTQDLGNYACNKSCAMGLRLEGKINNALAYEQACERIYKNLPDWARW